MLYFFFLMIRRPPRSTLFPYTNALPILDVIGGDEAASAGHIFDNDCRLPRNMFAHMPGNGASIGIKPSACGKADNDSRSEEHTSELQSQSNLVCRLLLEKKKKKKKIEKI